MIWPKYTILDADWSISKEYLNGPISIAYFGVVYCCYYTTNNTDEIADVTLLQICVQECIVSQRCYQITYDDDDDDESLFKTHNG